jgi:diazepam-binding inhibitor (GABA receptor modulating acyl-CoA-binding protein)
MLQCDLYWYSFRLFRDWITEKRAERTLRIGPLLYKLAPTSCVHVGAVCGRVCATTRAAVQRILMSALQDRFAQAQEDVNGLAERPDNNTMLKLYALYKQATQGDATGERPGGFDFVRAAKFDAWSEIKGTSAEDAMQQYIDLVASLRH